MCSIYNLLLSTESSLYKSYFHINEYHLAKIRQTFVQYTKTLETLRFVSQDEVNQKTIIDIAVAISLFNEVFEL